LSYCAWYKSISAFKQPIIEESGEWDDVFEQVHNRLSMEMALIALND